MTDLHAAILDVDFAVHVGGSGNPFGRGGLNLSIVSRVPQEQLDVVLNDHKEARKLEEAADATGIKDRINTASGQGHGYPRPFGFYALKASWKDGIGHSDTEHPVVFFLNPMASNTNKAGWYTVEELDEWLEGKGPVIQTMAYHHESAPSPFLSTQKPN